MEIFLLLIQLFVINLILSVDNAVLIAAFSKDLENKQRKQVTLFGTIFATLIKLVLILLFLFLLDQEFASIYLIGGLFLVGIGLFIDSSGQNESRTGDKNQKIIRLIGAIVLIDLFLSFDNSIIIADVASKINGVGWQVVLIILTLGMSFPIILFGANTLGKLLHEKKWILYLVSILLVASGIEMIVDASFIWANASYQEWNLGFQILMYLIIYLVAGLIVWGMYWIKKLWVNKKNTD